MAREPEEYGHPELVGGGETTLHSHPGGSADLKPWSAIDSSGDTVITTDTVVSIDTVKVANDGYTLSSNEITVNQDGTYLVSYSIAYDITNTTGSARGCTDGFVTLDGTAIAQSYSRVYHREASGGSGQSTSFVVEISSGEKLKLLVTRAYATTNIDTKAGRSNISILKVG